MVLGALPGSLSILTLAWPGGHNDPSCSREETTAPGRQVLESPMAVQRAGTWIREPSHLGACYMLVVGHSSIRQGINSSTQLSRGCYRNTHGAPARGTSPAGPAPCTPEGQQRPACGWRAPEVAREELRAEAMGSHVVRVSGCRNGDHRWVVMCLVTGSLRGGGGQGRSRETPRWWLSQEHEGRTSAAATGGKRSGLTGNVFLERAAELTWG